jgi:prepilin-type N-terminal cleavage/methylation domain-containing protein
MPYSPRQRGFTLIQLIVTISVLGILTLSLRPAVSNILEVMKQRSAVIAVKQTVLAARARAMANPTVHCGVFFSLIGNPRVIGMFEDTGNPNSYSYDANSDTPYRGPVNLPAGVTLDTIPGQTKTLIFRGDGSAYISSKFLITTGTRKDTMDILASTGRIKVSR